MGARLFSKTGDTRGLELEFDGEATIGREPSSHLAIDRPLMSGRHARISWNSDESRFVLEDLGSLNGTRLDGDRVTAPERLGHLHVITFAGKYDFFFQDLERCAQRHPEAPAASEETATGATETPPARPKEPSEVTAIESQPVELPSMIARRADALRDLEVQRPEEPHEVTSIDQEAIDLPSILARKADAASAPVDEAEPDETPPKEAEPLEPATREPSEMTVREKLPVALPGALARKADSVQQKDTVDLADIEDLIAEEDEAEAAALASATTGSNADQGLHLVITRSGGRVEQHPLVPGDNVIGRGAAVQVPLTYRDLSRRHALLHVTDERITLRDLGSRNRTFVDDEALDPEVAVEIQPGAKVRFGSVEARLVELGGTK